MVDKDNEDKNKNTPEADDYLNHAPDFIFKSRIDNFQFTEVNELACEFYGYSRAEFLNMQIFDIEVDVPLKEELRRLYDNTPIGKIIEVYGHNKRKDGSTFPVHVRLSKINDEFTVATARDISEIVARTNFRVVSNQLVSLQEVEFDKIKVLLSTREREVLALIGEGLSPTEISEKLGLSIKTVSTYRKRLLEKLDLKNAIELAQYSKFGKLVK